MPTGYLSTELSDIVVYPFL